MVGARTSKQTETDVESVGRRRALAGLGLSMLLAALGTSIANVALPELAAAFAAPFAQVQWVVLAYLLAITTMVVGAGRLGDAIGHRRLLVAALALFTAASALCGLAPSLWLLVAARAAQGFGAAAMMALAMAMVGEAVPKGKAGGTMGLLGTMSALGTALGPALGGLLIAGLGWRAVFLVTVPLGLVASVLAQRYLPADRDEAPNGARAGFDGLGTLLLALSLAAYALAMTGGRGFGLLEAGLLSAAALGAGLFLRVEARAGSPLIRPAMLRDRLLGAGLTMSALVSTVMMATLVVGPFYLARGLGLEAAAVGMVMSVGPLVAALAGGPAGRMVERFGAQRMTVAGLAGATAGAAALAVLPARLGVAGYVAPLAFLTAGYALFQAANNTAVMAGAGAARRGVVAGMLGLSRNLGLVTGASALAAVFAFATATDLMAAPPQAVAAGMRTTFAVATTILSIALALALRSADATAPARATSDRPEGR